MHRKVARKGGKKSRPKKFHFLRISLSLPPTEAQKFWPVYNELEHQRWEIQKKRHNLEVKVQEAEESLSDKEIIQLTRDYAGNMQKEGDLMVNIQRRIPENFCPRKRYLSYIKLKMISECICLKNTGTDAETTTRKRNNIKKDRRTTCLFYVI